MLVSRFSRSASAFSAAWDSGDNGLMSLRAAELTAVDPVVAGSAGLGACETCRGVRRTGFRSAASRSHASGDTLDCESNSGAGRMAQFASSPHDTMTINNRIDAHPNGNPGRPDYITPAVTFLSPDGWDG
jgi:hypothetical protein